MTDEPKVTLVDGGPVTDGYQDLKENGQQKDYLVLSSHERAKGFVRPVRRCYVHVGVRPKHPLRDLTEEEKERFGDTYVKFEHNPESDHPGVGRFWTEQQLNSGCGALTTMSLPIAETYARDPKFYGATFCTGCGVHHPVGEFVWDGSDDRVGS